MFENIKPKWYIGVFALLVTIMFFVFIAAPLQIRFGMWGFALTQLGILIIGLTPIFLFKWKITDVMPLKKVTMRQLSGVLVLLIATYFVVSTVSSITIYLFPEFGQMAAYMSEFTATVPFVVALLMMSVLTGICEEVLHRGLIQHSLKNHKNELAVMLVMAVLFGIFHLSPYRFLITAIVGFVLTYIMIKTRNFILPVVYHAVHNAIAVVIGYGADTSQPAQILRATIGELLILSAISPFLFFLGVKLLNNKKPGKKAKYMAIAFTFILPVLGIGIHVTAPAQATYVTNFSFTHYANNETEPSVFDNIIIEDAGMYDLFVSVSDETNTVITIVRVEHEDGEMVWELGGSEFFSNMPANLRAGVYSVTFTFESESEEMIPVGIRFSVRK